MSDKKKFINNTPTLKGFKFSGFEPQIEYKGNPYESIKLQDSKVNMQDIAAVFSKDTEDGYTDFSIGPKRLSIKFNKQFQFNRKKTLLER